MKAYLTLWLVCLTLIRGVHGSIASESSLGAACFSYLYTLGFDCGLDGMSNMIMDIGEQYSCLCTSKYFLGSAAVCVFDHNNSPRLINRAFKYLNQVCVENSGISVSHEQFMEYYADAKNNTRSATPDDSTDLVDAYVTINQSDWSYYHKTYKDFTFEVNRDIWFGWGLGFYWVTVLLIAGLFNLNENVLHFEFPAKLNNYVKRSWTLPLLGGTNHEEVRILWKFIPFRLPTKWDSIVVTIFVILSCIFCGIGFTMRFPNANFVDRYETSLDLVSLRTDVMLCLLLPVIYLFGIRNNIFIPLTGLSFANFNYYHKWCAYMMFMFSMIHTGLWTQYYLMYNIYKLNIWGVPYLQWGVVLTTVAGFLVFLSFKYFRDFAYEFFLILHKIFNLIFIVSMYYHVKGLMGMEWVWSMVGIWCGDRVLRFLRVLLSGGIQSTQCSIYDEGVIKLKIRKPKLMTYKPGSYLFFYFLSPWYLLWQSHPFTVTSSPIESASGELIVCFKLRKGTTSKVLKLLMKKSTDGKTLDIKFIIEGPYGGESLFNYSSHLSSQARKGVSNKVTGISAGMGVVSVFPHMAEILKHVEPKQSSNNSEKEAEESEGVVDQSQKSSYKLIWYINSLSHIEWFHDELMWLLERGCELSIVITRDVGLLDVDTESLDLTAIEKVNKEFVSLISFDLDKVKFQLLLNAEFSKAILSNMDLTIFSCGPSSFNDSLRAQVVDTLNIHKDASVNMNYRPESFTW